jgi:P-type Mg2+ transporter
MKVSAHHFTSAIGRLPTLKRFGRHPWVHTLAGRGPSQAAPETMTHELLSIAGDDTGSALTRLRSHLNGLTVREAAARLAHYGANEIPHEASRPPWLHLWDCYKNPFNVLLTLLATVSYLSADLKATTVISIMVVLSTLVRFIQERRSNHAAERLKALICNHTTVLRRDSKLTTTPDHSISPRHDIPIRKLVPGDIVLLSAGDMVPADCRLLTTCDLFVAQAALTGESLPVEKFADPRDPNLGALEQSNLAFMGTTIVSGSATALVVATGRHSYFGAISTRLAATDATPSAFQVGVNSVSWLLIRFALVMAPIVLIINGLTKGNWIEASLFALSVVVGLTPEMLPMIVTSTLAKGAVLLSRKKVVVKQLDAIHNFGAMDVLCTDKTGTLTQDRIALAQHCDISGQNSEAVLHYAFLNSHYQTGLKNLLDRAVLDHLEVSAALKLEEDYCKVDEIPFDFQRRRMSVIVSKRALQHELICKGAVEEVLVACSHVRLGPEAQDVPLDAATLAQVQAAIHQRNEDGLRVIAVAIKVLPPTQSTYSNADEVGLTLVGTIAFLDPPKESATPALRALAAHGIRVVVLTGDNALITAHVCRQVGLAADSILQGVQIETMDDGALADAVERYSVFTKLTPLNKERIVRALRARGHVVGFMGDGINDAPALRAADIGISVDSAVNIAKEAADIILLEKSLMVLDDGVMEGRRTFCNMLKYIRMTVSSNFGNVLSVLIASVVLPFLPMLPLQLLMQNLMYDFSQTTIPFDSVDAELLNRPLQWNPKGIGHFMLFFGPISSLFDLSTFALMWWGFQANSVATQSLFQSGWFVVGLLTQTLVVHMIRTPKLPFIESTASPPVIAMTLVMVTAGIFLPMGPLAGYFKFVALPLPYFAWLVIILLGYSLLTTMMKHYYVRRFGWD